MATLTIGTASGGYFNFRGANATPYAMGSSVVIQNTGGDINTTGGYEGVIFSQLTFQASGYTTTSSLYGNVWNSSGTSVTASSAVSAATDTTAPFGSKTFNLSDQYFATPQTVYVGYSRAAASPTAWDCVNGDNTTRVGNTAGSAPSGLTGTGTGTIYRRLVGTATYVLYDAGTITRSVSMPSSNIPSVSFGGANGTHAKTITVLWGDGTSSSTTIVASRNFSATPLTITKAAAYATKATYTITTTISYASTAVGIPDIPFSDTVYTTPSAAQTFTATAASSSQINLSWTAPSYVGLGTTSYQLYRTPAGGSATLVYNSTGTSFSDTGLSANTSYSYTIYATNNTGQSDLTASASATTSAGVPGTPTSFGYTSKTESSINLSWSAPSNNGGSAITGYTLYRGATQIYPTLPATSGIATSFNDTGLAFETSYSYSVYAVNAIGSSASPATSTISTDLGGKSVIWNGTQTVGAYPKVWNGSAWVTGQSKVWNGTSWAKGLGVTVPNTITTPGINNPSSGTVTYSITPPFNGNSAITGYYVEFWQIGIETDTFIGSSNSISGSFGYSGADTYAIFAYATNAVGNGSNARFDLNLI